MKHKISTGFSMIYMLDFVFLLLVFFVLTSSFITPSGIRVDLPEGSEATIELQKVSVTITRKLQYYVNNKKVTKAGLEGELKSRLTGDKGSVVILIDKDVPSEHLVYVANLAAGLEAKVVIATSQQ